MDGAPNGDDEVVVDTAPPPNGDCCDVFGPLPNCFLLLFMLSNGDDDEAIGPPPVAFEFDPKGLDDPKALDTDELAEDATVLLLLPNKGLVGTCDTFAVPKGDGFVDTIPVPDAFEGPPLAP